MFFVHIFFIDPSSPGHLRRQINSNLLAMYLLIRPRRVSNKKRILKGGFRDDRLEKLFLNIITYLSDFDMLSIYMTCRIDVEQFSHR